MPRRSHQLISVNQQLLCGYFQTKLQNRNIESPFHTKNLHLFSELDPEKIIYNYLLISCHTNKYSVSQTSNFPKFHLVKKNTPDKRPAVGRNPQMPHIWLGIRIDPPMSVPIPIREPRAAINAASPVGKSAMWVNGFRGSEKGH